MKKITKSFRVNPEVWTKVKVFCARKGVNLSSFLEEALKEKMNIKK
jgi:hypothetical protein